MDKNNEKKVQAIEKLDGLLLTFVLLAFLGASAGCIMLFVNQLVTEGVVCAIISVISVSLLAVLRSRVINCFWAFVDSEQSKKQNIESKKIYEKTTDNKESKNQILDKIALLESYMLTATNEEDKNDTLKEIEELKKI